MIKKRKKKRCQKGKKNKKDKVEKNNAALFFLVSSFILLSRLKSNITFCVPKKSNLLFTTSKDLLLTSKESQIPE